MAHEDLLAGPPETLLPDNPDARQALAAATDPSEVAARFPAYSAAWAALAERAMRSADPVTAYAYARTGYHRGLDQLRRAGWRGNGPIPWQHEPNRGFLRSLHMLAVAADAIGETDEARRCHDFLRDSSPAAALLLRGDDPPNPPDPALRSPPWHHALLARGDDPPKPPGNHAAVPAVASHGRGPTAPRAARSRLRRATHRSPLRLPPYRAAPLAVWSWVSGALFG